MPLSMLERDWWRPRLTWRTAALLPLALLFRGVVATRRTLYSWRILRADRLPVPVVVAGNLVVGGTGKTPLVIHLVDALRRAGRRPGVISRGYGGRPDAEATEVSPDDDPARTGDEPLLIRRRTGVPVFIARKRVAAGHALLAAHPEVDVVVCDDGLQHLALERDFEIALFDMRGAGNGHLLPAGPLREPLERSTSVDAVVANGDDLSIPHGFRMHLSQEALHRVGDPRQSCAIDGLAALAGPRIAAVAGIGDPPRFFAALRAAGMEAREYPFPDHHAFTAADLASIEADAIVMTEKDAIKCAHIPDPRLWVAPVSATVDRRLVEAILERMRGSQAA